MIAQHKKRKVNGKRVAILVCCTIVAIGVIAGGAMGVMHLFAKNPYEKYDTAREEGKQYGTLQHESEEQEDSSYISVFYPEFKEKGLNDAVAKYRKEHGKLDKHEGLQILSIDYDVEKLFDHYVVLTFHKKIYDEKDQLLKSEDVTYNYDLKTDKVMSIQDVLRRNYKEMLTKLAKNQKLTASVDKADLNNFVIGEKSVIIYLDTDRKEKLEVPYETYKAYIRLQDAKIPSYFQKLAATPAKEPEVDPNKPMIAFTFDDGPSQYTQQIMSEFEKYNGRATFFMLGQNVDQHPDVVKDMQKRGFELGNHSWDHSMGIGANASLNQQEVSDEVYMTQDAIYKLTGQEPHYFRPPYGAVSKRLLNANYLGYAFWDIDSKDWSSKNVDAIYKEVMHATKKGNIVVLLHDIYDPSMQSVKKLLPVLKKQGYQFVTYSTLKKYEGKYLEKVDATYGVPSEYASGR